MADAQCQQQKDDRRDSNNLSSIITVPSDEKDDDETLPEGGWGWMIVISLFLMFTVALGYVFSLAVFFVEWVRYFDASAARISWVVSLAPAAMGIFSPLAGALCTKYGSRRVAIVGSTIVFVGAIAGSFSESVVHLYITAGMLVTGAGFIFSPTLVMLGQYFQKRYILANSVAFCGVGFAQIVLPRLAQFLIEEYGWRGALLILSALLSHLYICAALLRPRKTRNRSRKVAIQTVSVQIPTKESEKISTSATSLHMYDNGVRDPSEITAALYVQDIYCDKEQKKINEQRSSLMTTCRTAFARMVSYMANTYGISALTKSVLYVFTLLASFAGGVGWFVTLGHLVARAVSVGISQNDAALLITLMGLGGLVGRAGHGIIIDKGFISREVVFTASFAFTGLLSFVCPFLDTYIPLCVFAYLFGLFYGIAYTLALPMMKLQMAPSEAAAALSFGMLALAVSNTVGGVLAGVLYDITGNYDISFYFAGAMITAGTLMLFVVYLLNHLKQKRLSKHLDMGLDNNQLDSTS